MAASKGCVGCLRVWLLISNVISLIIGDVIVGAGIYFALFDGQPSVQELNRALPSEFFALRVTLIAFGGLVVLVSFCACVGVVLKSRCALILYSVLTAMIALACLAAAVAMVAMPGIRTTAQSRAELSLRRSYGNASLVTLAVDTAQAKLTCCGWQLDDASSPSATSAEGTDAATPCGWFGGTAWHRRNECPPSCCPAESSAACRQDSVHRTSCFSTLAKYIVAIPIAFAVGTVLSFCHLICALTLVMRQSAEQISSV